LRLCALMKTHDVVQALSPSPGYRPLRWRALALAVILVACRGRMPLSPTVDWKPRPGARPEVAALLLLDKDGMAKVVCLPRRTGERQPFPGVALGKILDVGWNRGPMVAGLAAASDDADQSTVDQLVLLDPHSGPRRLAKGVRAARFSPDTAALAYEVAPLRNGGASVVPPTSHVLDLATGNSTEIGAFADPLWEADGRHLRATRLRTASEERRATPGQWTSLRVRWDRASGMVTIDGPGSAQLPAPVGESVAWSAEQRSLVAPRQCFVLLRPQGGVRHSIVGRFCAGSADDRGVRWSPDGRWLAFPHPGPVPGQQKPGEFFVDVVGVEGGRYPALSELQARARPEQLAIAAGPGTVWFDWSPSGRFLALHDGSSDLHVYDFETHGSAFLGKGQRPRWSPGGAYLLILEAGQAAATVGVSPSQGSQDPDRLVLHAFVLSGVDPAARIDLGLVRDARWLPTQACENGQIP
jgi:hypothetical protein